MFIHKLAVEVFERTLFNTFAITWLFLMCKIRTLVSQKHQLLRLYCSSPLLIQWFKKEKQVNISTTLDKHRKNKEVKDRDW